MNNNKTIPSLEDLEARTFVVHNLIEYKGFSLDMYAYMTGVQYQIRDSENNDLGNYFSHDKAYDAFVALCKESKQ